jgi:hypothetical protein
VLLAVADGCETHVAKPFSLLTVAGCCARSGVKVVSTGRLVTSRFTRSLKKLSETNPLSDDRRLPLPQKTREKIL